MSCKPIIAKLFDLIVSVAGSLNAQKCHFYPAFCFQQESSGAEPGPVLNSGSLISGFIYISILNQVQGDNTVFPQQKLINRGIFVT